MHGLNAVYTMDSDMTYFRRLQNLMAVFIVIQIRKKMCICLKGFLSLDSPISSF